jgi:hypothetical protein
LDLSIIINIMMNIIAKTIKAALLVALISLLSITTSSAANFYVADNKKTLILDGPILKGDFKKFMKLVEENPKSKVLLLNSGGGFAIEGFKIGIYVNRNNFNTYVPSGAHCASACSFIWLAGNYKFWGKGGDIFFHSIFSAIGDPTNDPKVTPKDKILTSYYMGDIKASFPLAVEIVENTNPTTFLKLTKNLVMSYGIQNVVLVDDVRPEPEIKPNPAKVN